jgi:ectoine hydroxylase-related dioxygenase (phytanoyl-CoA dioxygenase family)
MSITLEDGRLSHEAQAQYQADGFLFPIDAVSAGQAAAWRAELETIEADWLDRDLPQPLNTYKRVNSHLVMPLAYEIGSCPAILDVVEGVLGPDIMIYAVEFFIKEARTKAIVTMHQDLTYWGLGATQGLTTAWLALSPATPASGCMDFVRGSHKNPILPHDDTFDANNLLSRGQEVRVDVDPADKTAITLQPGQISLHHGLTIHGSGPNVSDDRRIAAVIRYVRPDVSQEVGETDHAMLVRGRDTFGNFRQVPPPSGLFTPLDLALYEEIRTAQAAVMMKGAKDASGIYS